jgi:hypothetical protein
VKVSANGRIVRGGGCPAVRAGIVSPAGVTNADALSTPDDHFTASPHCRVTVSGRGCIRSAAGRPAIRAGIVSPAGVQKGGAGPPAPDNHFTASPHCRVSVSHRARWLC